MEKNQYRTDDNYKWVVYTLIFPIINWFIFFIGDYTNERIIKRIDIYCVLEDLIVYFEVFVC